MLSASNMPPPHELHNYCFRRDVKEIPTTVLLLPAFALIDNVVPSNVPDLVRDHINPAPTNTTPLHTAPSTATTASSDADLTLSRFSSPNSALQLVSRPCPHDYLILLCSQKTRDARCGQSAPLLRRELERHLRPLGLYRDLQDERPGGVGIYFISHVGGHKFAANVMVYRRAGSAGARAPRTSDGEGGGLAPESHTDGKEETVESREAAQCIWLARVRPEDCENIVRYTVLQGKVVKPDRQLRGGFDRRKGLVSW